MKYFTCLLAFCAFLASPSLFAQSAGQAFLSATFGQVSVNDTDGLLRDDSDTAIGFSVGYMLGENLGVEVGYKNLGKYGIKPIQVYRLRNSFRDGTADFTGNAEATGIHFGLVGVVPSPSGTDVYGKIGFLMSEVDYNATVDPSGASLLPYTGGDSTDGTNLYFGFGVKRNLSKEAGMGVEWTRYSVGGKETIDLDSSSTHTIPYEAMEEDVTVIGVTVFVNF